MKKWIISSCALLLSYAVKAQTLHLLIVVDTNETGRQMDRTRDYHLMTQFWRETAEYTSVPFKTTHLGTSNFDTSSVLKTCRNMTIEPKDIVVFYFSGHGANDRSAKWPVLALRNANLRTTDVIRTLRERNPKCLVVMSDCCNSYFNKGQLPPAQSNPQDEQLYKDLFLNFKGQRQVLIAASQPGEYSYSHKREGSFWGVAFREAFRREMDNSKTSTNWNSILELTKKLAAIATQQKQTEIFDVITQGDAFDED